MQKWSRDHSDRLNLLMSFFTEWVVLIQFFSGDSCFCSSLSAAKQDKSTSDPLRWKQSAGLGG